MLIITICLVQLGKRQSFAGKRWLQTFATLTLIIAAVGFLIGLLAASLPPRFIKFYFDVVNSSLGLAASLAFFMFVLNAKRTGSESTSAHVQLTEPGSLMPSPWLMVPAVLAGLLCIENNTSGTLLQSIAISLTNPGSGGGAARQFARELEVSGTHANLAGGLYLLTAALCIAVAVDFSLRFLRKRKANIATLENN